MHVFTRCLIYFAIGFCGSYLLRTLGVSFMPALLIVMIITFFTGLYLPRAEDK